MTPQKILFLYKHQVRTADGDRMKLFKAYCWAVRQATIYAWGDVEGPSYWRRDSKGGVRYRCVINLIEWNTPKLAKECSPWHKCQ